MRVIPQGGAPKKGGPEASASLASPLNTPLVIDGNYPRSQLSWGGSCHRWQLCGWRLSRWLLPGYPT